MKQLQFSTPLGLLVVTSNTKGIESILFRDHTEAPDHSNDMLLLDCKAQFDAYFKGSLQQFDLPLAAIGTDFQQAVWQQLSQIPFAQLRSYSDIAHALNNPKAVRAVGAANGRNPLTIIVPCHRVIGANGSLTGYAGGLERKDWLLKHEQNTAQALGLFQLEASIAP
ncbi:methylated-DNA--[protein]-cysteine S-methyltransferase [Rheinheimera soli]|uniref:methylated-DNA--[protein]-cysteine S-methyltransferase n=1 Tax=Rheinheimera soli TaxID=443616 RepID=UPI001E5AD6DD|nr:methylated-DNA--[protein]-cysteine S-methyltransferase [Rheinheimera soli]